MNRLIPSTLLALTIAGCAVSKYPPAPPKAAQSEYAYRLGPGDMISINVWKNSELTAQVPIRPDGRITAPLIEDLMAVGKTPTQLGNEIEGILKEFVRNPSVNVLVTNFVGDSPEQVRVVGQAAKPTALPYKYNMTLLDVMIAVGGITEFAAGNRAVLIRKAEENKPYSIRLTDLMQGGDVSANVEMLPGDVVMIPESRF